VTLAGDDLGGLRVDLPAASVRVLLPDPRSRELVVPVWNGNEFLLPDGRRPAIRTFTPSLVDEGSTELDIEIVLHGSGAASEWAAAAHPGAPAAVSGPGRGYTVDPDAPAYLVAGDETALPAIGQLLTAIPAATPVDVLVELADASARLPLGERDGVALRWLDAVDGAAPGTALVDAIRGCELAPEVRVWAAGEAAAVQQIRKHLFDDRGLARPRCTVRGYWKHGRRGGDGD
jgi:NADPH-dependent ferric siderophore reductase